MSSLVQNRWLTAWLMVVSYIAVANAQCYYPGGAWAPDQFPCFKNDYTSLCCPSGWTCFSNKLCIATDSGVVSSSLPLGTAMRGTCTNPLWNNTACGDFCLGDPVSANSGSVIPCGDNKWCCQPDSADGTCNCSTGKGIFDVSDGTAQTIIGVVGLQQTITGPVMTSTGSVMTSTGSVVGPSSSASTSKPQSSSTFISTSAASSTPTASSGDANVNQTNNSSIPVKVGVGVAVGIVFLFVIGLIIWFLRCRRRRGSTSQTELASDRDTGTQSPMTGEYQFRAVPAPHPYGDAQFSASQSRAALAEQNSHNRRMRRQLSIPIENNPYADQ